MTFIPTVLSKTDNNNSSIGSSTTVFPFTGTYTSTLGFNTIQVNITPVTSNAISSCILKIYFSWDSTNTSYIISDTFTSGNNFNKKYNILDSYYKLVITSCNTPIIISTRLSTDTLTPESNSLNSFDNNQEYKLDAFGKLRVSEPNTILDLRFPVGISGNTGSFNFLSNNQQICATSVTGATGVYNNAKLVASVSGVNKYYISQSRNYCVYQPGKSLLFLGTGVLNANTNTTYIYTRIGYFDNNVPISTVPTVKNGMYFEYSNSVISVNYCNNSSNTSITQTNWNIDTMDGSGSSGFNLDFTKAQLFVIDMEWLSVGRVRYGFYIYGKIVYCHQITNINSLTGPYTTEINLPVCYSIHSGTTGGTGSLTQICSSVISEGGYEPIGKAFSINSNGVAIPKTNFNEIVILSLRGGSNVGNYNHQNIIPKSIYILDSANSSNNVFLFKIRIFRDGNVPLASMTWTDIDSPSYSSVTQYSITGSTSTVIPDSSIIVEEGLFSGKTSISVNDLSSVFTNNILQITSNISNTSDILCLTCTLLNTATSDSTIFATISWNEYY